MFLKDIDLIFKRFKNLLDGSSGLFGSRLFQPFSNKNDFLFLLVSKNIIYFENYWGCFLNCLEYLGVFSDKEYWF